MNTRCIIIGVDCAVNPRRVGLARAEVRETRAVVDVVETGTTDCSLVSRVSSWIEGGATTILALDAPLGWPSDMGTILDRHRAGDPIDVAPDRMFRRETDRVVKERIGRNPLDVGADRIARTAVAGLELLRSLRDVLNERIPLASSPGLRDGVHAIEVYPAATLAAHGLRASGYKKREQGDARRELIDALAEIIALPRDCSLMESQADALDAVVCVLAGWDFLTGDAIAPTHTDLAEKEGWIWVRDPKHGRGNT